MRMPPTIGALFAAVCALMLPPVPARGQGVVFASSDALVTIHSTFTGQVLTLFGNIEPGQGGVPQTGPYDVVIVVRGPASDRVVRARARQFGLVLNADQASYRRLPGYYAVLSSRPLDALDATEELTGDPRFSIPALVASARMKGDGEIFDPELVRLMTDGGLFHRNARGVSFLSPTTFSTRVPLPSHVPNGPFVAQAFVIAGDGIAASAATRFTVRTEGFERFVSRSAQACPLPYGIAAVIIAIVIGWVGGVLFKR